MSLNASWVLEEACTSGANGANTLQGWSRGGHQAGILPHTTAAVSLTCIV